MSNSSDVLIALNDGIPVGSVVMVRKTPCWGHARQVGRIGIIKSKLPPLIERNPWLFIKPEQADKRYKEPDYTVSDIHGWAKRGHLVEQGCLEVLEWGDNADE